MFDKFDQVSVDHIRRTRQDSRQAARDERKRMKEEIAQSGLCFTYVRQFDEETGEPNQYGGAVFAWEMPTRQPQTILPVAAAWCHPEEKFDSVMGRFRAMVAFKHGQKMPVRLPHNDGMYSASLRTLFEGCLDG